MTDMTGPTNYGKIGYYFCMTYYLFPREIGTSLDHKTRVTKDGFLGQTSESDQEILSNGFDVRIDIISDLDWLPKNFGKLSLRDPVNPEWFDSYFDHGHCLSASVVDGVGRNVAVPFFVPHFE